MWPQYWLLIGHREGRFLLLSLLFCPCFFPFTFLCWNNQRPKCNNWKETDFMFKDIWPRREKCLYSIMSSSLSNRTLTNLYSRKKITKSTLKSNGDPMKTWRAFEEHLKAVKEPWTKNYWDFLSFHWSQKKSKVIDWKHFGMDLDQSLTINKTSAAWQAETKHQGE